MWRKTTVWGLHTREPRYVTKNKKNLKKGNGSLLISEKISRVPIMLNGELIMCNKIASVDYVEKDRKRLITL